MNPHFKRAHCPKTPWQSKLSEPVQSKRPHNMNDDRNPTDFHHRLRAKLGFLAHSRAETAGKENHFHVGSLLLESAVFVRDTATFGGH